MPAQSSSFAEKLRAIRERKGVSQYALAKRSGLSKQALSRLEAGAREPSWNTVQRLAAALGADCRDFMDAGLELPDVEEPRPKGRPRKEADASRVPGLSREAKPKSARSRTPKA